MFTPSLGTEYIIGVCWNAEEGVLCHSLFWHTNGSTQKCLPYWACRDSAHCSEVKRGMETPSHRVAFSSMRAAANSFSAVNVFFVALCHCLACTTIDHAGTSGCVFIVDYPPGCILFSPAALTHLSPQTCVSRAPLVVLPYAMFLLSSLAY